MKTKFLIVALAFSMAAIASQGKDIYLPKPTLSEEATLKYALENRCSQREYDKTAEIDIKELSNLLWAGWGYNRDDKRTAPSALDKQEITLYVCTRNGAYRYDADLNRLIKVSSKNIMKQSGKQPFVEDASVNLIYVCNNEESISPMMSAICCGAISQNISLYCATAGLGTVVRGSFDSQILKKELKLSSSFDIIMAQSIGYPTTTHDKK